jgi:hypothetical protein
MSWEGWRGHLHSTWLRRAAHQRKIGTHEGSDKGTAPALRGAEHVARSQQAERQMRVVKTREQQRSRHDGGGLVVLQATAESASSRDVHSTVRLCRPSPEVRRSGLAAWGGCKDTAADSKRRQQKVGWSRAGMMNIEYRIPNCRGVGAWRSGDVWASVLQDHGPRHGGCAMRRATVGLRPLQPRTVGEWSIWQQGRRPGACRVEMDFTRRTRTEIIKSLV